MALITLGAIVSMRVVSSTLLTPIQPQPPKFGKVVVADGPPATAVSVLWDDGRLQATIPVAGLDNIEEAAPAEQTRLVGQLVRVQPSGASVSENAAYDAMVIALYTRADGGSQQGTPGPTLALVVTTQGNPLYREVPSADLQVPTGR